MSVRKWITVSVSLLLIALGLYFAHRAIHSSQFTLRVIEVAFQSEANLPEWPMTEAEVQRLAEVEPQRDNLFSLSLREIENKLRAHKWIESVELQKRFPETLSIQVHLRNPIALVQGEKGELSYLDAEAQTFKPVNPKIALDLPLVAGIESTNTVGLKNALDFVQRWESSGVKTLSQLSSVTWTPSQGIRAWVTYPMATDGSLSRSRLELGNSDYSLDNLRKVIQYLNRKSITAQNIVALDSKKIVVKTARGS